MATQEIMTEYINLQTDFGFKQAFGNEANKGALIRFLNALFEGHLTVRDVTFHDKEILPSDPDGKRIVYDVYCTSPVRRSDSPYYTALQAKHGNENKFEDHHIILEMQNIYTPPFEERIVFYASKMVAGQGKSGWDYELEPVFAVAVTDFNFSHMSPKLVRDVMLVDRESGEALTDKVHILLCSLKEVPSEWGSCRTEIERILFLIKNMDKMDSTSTAYREGNFTEIFDAARSSRLRKDDIIPYSQSLQKLRDTQRGIQYAAELAAEQAAERAAKRARADALVEGREEERKEIARRMLQMGVPPHTVSSFTGLTLSEVEELLN